jgi:uncharacterized membrane protein YeaQ/YmgE (transglycosylase-associated protein family)
VWTYPGSMRRGWVGALVIVGLLVLLALSTASGTGHSFVTGALAALLVLAVAYLASGRSP